MENKGQMKEKNKGQIFLMVIGCLLILAAVVLTSFNIQEDTKAQKKSASILNILLEREKKEKEKLEDENVIYPDREMPTVEIGKSRYIGILEIPKWNLSLPVMEEWSEVNARTAPCRYQGSIYQDDMIIAGHNYQSHFGKLKNISLGEEVKFTDTEGHSFYFNVSSRETISDTDYDQMVLGEWDLILFTCTYNGTKRDIIRCVKKDLFIK